jgi:hypothetical protein
MFPLFICKQGTRNIRYALLFFLLVMPVGVNAEEYVEKTLFLVNEDDRVVAVNAETGQFFDFIISAKERVQDRFVANGVAILVTNQRFAGVGIYPSGWVSLRRKAQEKVVSVEVADRSAVLVTSDRILTFSSKSGVWSETRR